MKEQKQTQQFLSHFTALYLQIGVNFNESWVFNGKSSQQLVVVVVVWLIGLMFGGPSQITLLHHYHSTGVPLLWDHRWMILGSKHSALNNRFSYLSVNMSGERESNWFNWELAPPLIRIHMNLLDWANQALIRTIDYPDSELAPEWAAVVWFEVRRAMTGRQMYFDFYLFCCVNRREDIF